MLTIDFDLLELKDTAWVLDAGCGNGRHIWETCKRNSCSTIALDMDVPSLDNAKYMLQQMDAKGETKGTWGLLMGNVTCLPFRSRTFNRIICSEVLEHIPNDQKAVDELIRVLKDDGILAVSVPSYFTESVCWIISKDYHSFPGGHIRKYKGKEIIRLLQKSGLTVFAVRYKHALHSFYWWMRGIFGVKNEKAKLPTLYHKFLVWDICNGHKYTRWLEDILNNIIPKSIVLYCRKNMTLVKLENQIS